MNRFRTTPLAVALVLVVVVAAMGAGCAGSDDRSASSDSAGGPALAESDVGSMSDDGSGGGSDGGSAEEEPGRASTVAVTVTDPDAKKIRTGTVELEADADDVAGAANRVATIAEAAGGSVDEQRSTGGRRPSSDLVVRVPPERFRAVMADIEDVAKVRSSASETADVTGRYADLDGRLAAMRISTERLRGFLAKATDVNQIASLEGELTRREAELESTQAQLDALSAQVEMATIRVALTSTPVAVSGGGSEPPSPAGALARGWEAFVAAVRYLAAGVALALPFLVVAAVGVAVARWSRKSTSNRRNAAVSSS